ncbi:hypothetical protein [Blastococcus tunisiensis]|uniref:Uncharacterized protein n=1 Tax=Blastococcus tunisiensis TaxID=1798228 RepID=A0A1I2AIX8_9ACTN|nr:hypothetical protein [Blastococcus sp. DSM 46838]SFE43955.1 hypothetical protein SAMN05216574_103341 [Blastococcus sp. DSM 46838]
MSGIETDVLETFLMRIAASEEVSDSVVEGLRERLTASRIPKPEELAELFANGSGDALA